MTDHTQGKGEGHAQPIHGLVVTFSGMKCMRTFKRREIMYEDVSYWDERYGDVTYVDVSSLYPLKDNILATPTSVQRSVLRVSRRDQP